MTRNDSSAACSAARTPATQRGAPSSALVKNWSERSGRRRPRDRGRVRSRTLRVTLTLPWSPPRPPLRRTRLGASARERPHRALRVRERRRSLVGNGASRRACQARSWRASAAVSDGVLPTLTPAASRASFFACAVPDEPRHDGAGVAHRLALGGGEAGDVADDRLGHVLLDVGRGPLLGVATDLTDHHDDLGVGVRLERREGVDVRGADDRVAADADGRREPEVPQLVHHLVGQRAGLGDQADAAGAR